MEALNLDTVVVIDKTGYDEEFTSESHPGMIGYIVSTDQPGRAIMRIEIPIDWVVVDGT